MFATEEREREREREILLTIKKRNACVLAGIASIVCVFCTHI